MEVYDEDLNQNQFFLQFKEKFQNLFLTATKKGWTICVPRTGSFVDLNFEEADFENHVLLQESVSEQNCDRFFTSNGKECDVKGGIIYTLSGFSVRRQVNILFEETFYTEHGQNYQVICLDGPLEGSATPTVPTSVDQQQPQILRCLGDCENVLWKKDGSHKVERGISELVKQFKTSLRFSQVFSLDNLLFSVKEFYEKGYRIIMKNSALRKRCEKEPQELSNVQAALETYLQSKTYRDVFEHLSVCYSPKDSSFNKITRNLKHVQLKDLDVRPDSCTSVPRARQELLNLPRYSTRRGKLTCLRRSLRALLNPQAWSCHQRAAPLCTDDILPILVFLVLKSDIAHWWATFSYLSHFFLPGSPQEDENSYYLASLEAALEHISSGHLQEHLNKQVGKLMPSVLDKGKDDSQIWSQSDGALSRQDRFFQCIAENKPADAAVILDSMTSPVAWSSVALCHPLCQCPRCQQILGYRHQERKELELGVGSFNHEGRAALHIAALLGNVEALDWLVERGAEVNVKDFEGQTPLHLACATGIQSSTLLLLHHMADPNMQDNGGNTPLYLASLRGHSDCVKALIYYDQGNTVLDMDRANDFGDRPLHAASKWGYRNLCYNLIENGASPFVKNRHNETPLNIAHNLLIKDMLKKAAENFSSNTGSPKHLQAIKPSEAASLSSSEPDAKLKGHSQSLTGHSPSQRQCSKIDKTLRAIMDGDIPMAKHHLGFNAADEEADPDRSVLLPATGQQSLPVPVKLCHPLCQCTKCAPFTKVDCFNSEGGHRVNMVGTDGATPLHVAAQCGHASMVRWLLERGALPDTREALLGRSALHMATDVENMEVARSLLVAGADVNLTECKGRTALHLACLAGNDNLCTLLLDFHASYDLIDLRGQTPLHCAARKNQLTCVELLLRRGAQLDALDHQGYLPVQLTKSENVRATLQRAAKIRCIDKAIHHNNTGSPSEQYQEQLLPSTRDIQDNFYKPEKENPNTSNSSNSTSSNICANCSNEKEIESQKYEENGWDVLQQLDETESFEFVDDNESVGKDTDHKIETGDESRQSLDSSTLDIMNVPGVDSPACVECVNSISDLTRSEAK